MENLNSENAKKWLEICAEDTPYPDQSQALLDTLALITSQEQRIKELTEEVASWKEITETYQKQFEDCAEDRAKLTEENKAWQEQLISQKEKADKAYYELACEVEDLRAENEKLHATCTELTQECASLTEENERLRKNLETFKGKQKSLQKQIEVLSKENHLLLSKDFDVTIGDCHIVFSNGKKGNIYTFTEKDQIEKEMLEGE